MYRRVFIRSCFSDVSLYSLRVLRIFSMGLGLTYIVIDWFKSKRIENNFQSGSIGLIGVIKKAWWIAPD